MFADRGLDPALEWLNHVQPVGLVVAPKVLKDHALQPERQSRVDSDLAAELISPGDGESMAAWAWRFCSSLLGWLAARCPGAPGGPAGDDLPSLFLPEQKHRITPSFGVKGDGEQPWRLLVRVEARGVDPDQRGALEGWDATPHQQFERLLRESGVFAGLLITERSLRLIYAPRGETAGWLAFPLQPLGQTDGRAMLGGLKLMLGSFRLLGDAPERRLPELLRQSREAQAAVSEQLAKQILGALHELLRGIDLAEPELIRELAADDPHRLYEGVLTVLMRLVFILYAEDRDLLPSSTNGEARKVYEDGYSLRGLFDRLSEDEALNPDTMDERVGGWGRLIALFRLIHGGHGQWIKGRGGKLFDPDQFLFLEGRSAKAEPPRILTLADGCLSRVLRGLMILKGERLSYRTLDVEQIGSVYETVMGFTVERALAPMVAIKGGKHNDTPVFVDLDGLLATKDRTKFLKEATDRELTAKQTTAVNAAKTRDALLAALSPVIDERGSPDHAACHAGTPILQPTDERRRTGSHYTPRSLTGPIVEKALTPILARLGAKPTPEQILELKVCDPAMGSGAFLVEACRALARALVTAWEHHPESKPVILDDEDEELHARRTVAQRCLYGVDRNPMAVDLARLSLWLATLASDHEFTFLDHALKCGDSLVGLTRAQISAVTWSEPKAGFPLIGQLIGHFLTKVGQAREEIRTAPDDVAREAQEGRHQWAERELTWVRWIGDAIVASFFASNKPKIRKEALARLAEMLGAPQPDWEVVRSLRIGLRDDRHEIIPFHWEAELPEVFSREDPGFDAIVGNPPFAGKNTIASGHPAGYGEWLKILHDGSHGNADLCAHFFRRAYGLLRQDGVFGLIATNTIAQGDTRATGLQRILASGGTIIDSTRRKKWPGTAAVVVSVVHVLKGRPLQGSMPLLDGREVERISAYLVQGDYDDSPAPLRANQGKAFQGSIVLGMGFTFDDTDKKGVASPLAEMRRLIAKDPRNAELIKPYIGGEEVNNHPEHAHHRYVIDFGDMSEQEARRWPDLMAIVEAKVKPVRAKDNRKVYRDYWWRFAERRAALGSAIAPLDHVWADNCGATPHLALGRVNAQATLANTLAVFAFSTFAPLAVLQSRIHEVWARSFSSSMKDDLRYTPSDCFATFPFPPSYENDPVLEDIGRRYHDHRAALMVTANEGMTKTYNRFHKPKDKRPAIAELRALHAKMDAAVLRAYGWDDLAADATTKFLREDNETEFAYQNRLFWPATFRDEILARLLDLNRSRAAEEAGAIEIKGARRA